LFEVMLDKIIWRRCFMRDRKKGHHAGKRKTKHTVEIVPPPPFNEFN